MNNYRIIFTELAKAFANAKWSLAAVEEQARGELAELALEMQEDGKQFENWRGFHTIKMPGQSYFHDQLFMAFPSHDEEGFYVKIDTSTREDSDITLDKGPFKGYKVSIPMPDSE